MFDTASASNGVKLALLEGQLLTREIDRAAFIERAANLGLPGPAIGDAADKFMDRRQPSGSARHPEVEL
jgi:choline dehydrogenase